jgi:sugar phosphate isomerase/epimerase
VKVSISNIAWTNAEEGAIAELLQQMNVTGVDVAYTKLWKSPFDAPEDALSSYRAFWENHQIQIVGMQSLIYGRPDLVLFGDQAGRAQMADYLGAVCRLGGVLGAEKLVFGSPKNRQKGDLPLLEAMAIATEFFSGVAELAEEAGVTLCIEPNPPLYDCDFVQSTPAAIELVKRVNHPNFRLHLDAAIMTMNDEPIEAALGQAMEYLVHFHVSEPNLAVIGTKGVDHARFAQALLVNGYTGWVAIEMRSGTEGTNIEAVRHALDTTFEYYL